MIKYLITTLLLVVSLCSNGQVIQYNTLNGGRLFGIITNNGTITGGTYTSGTFSGITNTFSNIPNTSITGLGTMSTQNSNSVAITGGTISGLTITGSTISNTNVTGLGTMSTQNASAVAITGGTLAGITTLSSTGNPTFDAGSGTNTLTLRDGTISKLTGSGFTFNNSVTSTGIITGYGLGTDNGSAINTGTTLGIKIKIPAFIANDASTAASGTNAFSSNFSLGIPTLTATNANVTTTTAANLYIAGDPLAGTNQNLTSSYGLYNVGKSYFNNSAVFASSIFANTIKSNGTNIDFQSSAATPWARFANATGNFLIGTTTDNTNDKLQVSGDVSVSGKINAARHNALGSISTSAVGVSGIQYQGQAATLNDIATSASGTLAHNVGSGFGIPTMTATNTGVTYTTASNVYIAGDPVAGTNVTIGTGYGLYNVGKSFLGGQVIANGNGTAFSVPNGNTSLSNTTSINRLVASTNITGVPSTAGQQFAFSAYTNSDNVTGASGTVAHAVSHGIGIPTLSATNTAVTYTNASNLYIAGPPVAGTNVTITNPYALHISTGNTYFGGTTNFMTGSLVPVSNNSSNVGSSTNQLGTLYTGIVTAQSGSTLSLNTAGSNSVTFTLGGTKFAHLFPSTGALILQSGGTFTDNGVDRLQIGGSATFTGNLKTSGVSAIGATIPASLGTNSNLFIGQAGNLSAPTSGNAVYINGNAYQNATSNTWIYPNTGFATTYQASNGDYSWFSAPSGSAGATISFAQKMSLTQAGNLMLGAFTDDGVNKLQITGSVAVTSKINFGATNTTAGTTGAQTINKPTGTVNVAASGTSVVVTNSLVTTSSIVYAVIRSNDTTALIKNVVPGSGTFTITLNAAATAETSIGFIVFN